ncbi:MAG: hypothetical protein KGD70_06830 [Candidatus Lokiarchaeota archaeon]|nr:hypothetical protein [Candidatus Lokiarchaeota archaeon]
MIEFLNEILDFRHFYPDQTPENPLGHYSTVNQKDVLIDELKSDVVNIFIPRKRYSY